MLQLSPDHSFHYEILRTLAHARYYGADVGEVLQAAQGIEPGDFESFSKAFDALATRVYNQAEKIDQSRYPVSARDAYFRASNYFRAADFYLHGKPEDPRIDELWTKQTDAFDKANALLSSPGQRVTLKSDGFDVVGIYYQTQVGDPAAPKATLILGNGYDGAQEEMLHVCGFAALERGYNVIAYEGPGQPTVRRQQCKGFITEWEKVITPVVDFLEGRPEVDSKRIGLMGYSMGGWLCLRAAAFEHRIAAAIAVDGVYSVGQAYSNMLPPPWAALREKGDTRGLDAAVRGFLGNPKAPTGLQWGIEQGLWSFNLTSPSKYLDESDLMTLEGISDRIQCPVWVGEAGEDEFFRGQPEKVKDALGDRATLVKLGMEDAAGHHCHVGAAVLMNQVVFDWFEDIVSKK
ncbi:Alpha/Beta hydrolase protein [Exophiala viscosa]|uniref:Alpha/Beta hydrolase protein n=1 Tax=Exophiala viscosa TaxID=2486360 RepID=A0AAN6DR62_9EURO|nr:Alpha/Beta hydrolase protein [Exophiala viscosa]